MEQSKPDVEKRDVQRPNERIRQLESALAQSERKAQAILEASPLGVHMYRLTDDQLVFIGANPAADRILGVDNASFVGQTIEAAFPPLADTEVPQRYRAAARDGTPWQTVQIDYQDDQITGAFEVYAFQTQPGEMAVLFHDITERQRTEAELAQYRDHLEVLVAKRTETLKRTQKQLVAAERLAVLGKFAGTIAHEIRNPLTAIANAAYYLQRRLSDGDDKIRAQLERIERQIERTSGIIDSVLKLTRPSPPTKEAVDVATLAREAVTRAALRDSIAVEWALAEPPLQVSADPQQLAIALDNLLRNAAQAMPEGGHLVVGSRAAHHDGVAGIELWVGDTGLGIDEADQEAIFEPLFTTKPYGVGFGLSIVLLILERHGGTVEVTSAPDEGATFTLWLPE